MVRGPGFDIRKVKAPLAQEALDTGRDRGSLLEPARAQQLRELHEKLFQATETTATPPEMQPGPG